jgi:hypothetical protein
VNTSNGRIGIGGGQSITSGEIVKIEFVVNAEEDLVDPLDGTGFDWLAMSETTAFRQEVNRISGPQTNGANFTVYALNTDDNLDDEIIEDLPVSLGGTGVIGALDTAVQITNVLLYDANDQVIFNLDTTLLVPAVAGTLETYTINGFDSDGTAYSVTVAIDTADPEAGVVFTGVLEGWEYGIETDQFDPFDSVAVQGDAGGFDFTLGALILGVATNSEPFDMKFDIAGSDSDGDTLTDTITLQIDQPSEAQLQQLSIQSTSFEGGTEGGGGGGGTDTSGFFDGGGSGSGPSGFGESFFGEGGSTEFNLLGNISQFTQNSFDNQVPSAYDGFDKAGALVINDPQIVNGMELNAIGDTFGGELGLAADQGLGGVNEFNASATGDLSLADMVDQHDFDLGSLLGQNPTWGGLDTVPVESVETGLSGGIVALQLADEMTYNHS